MILYKLVTGNIFLILSYGNTVSRIVLFEAYHTFTESVNEFLELIFNHLDAILS